MSERETRSLDELWRELEKAREAERKEAERQVAEKQAQNEKAGREKRQ